MTDATLKAFILEYAELHGLDPVDVGMIAGSLIPDYMQSRPECLCFVLELRQSAPSLFETIKLLKNHGGTKNDIS